MPMEYNFDNLSPQDLQYLSGTGPTNEGRGQGRFSDIDTNQLPTDHLNAVVDAAGDPVQNRQVQAQLDAAKARLPDPGVSRLFGTGQGSIVDGLNKAAGATTIAGNSAIEEIMKMGRGLSSAVGASGVSQGFNDIVNKQEALSSQLQQNSGISDTTKNVAQGLGAMAPYFIQPELGAGAGGAAIGGGIAGALAGATSITDRDSALQVLAKLGGGATAGAAMGAGVNTGLNLLGSTLSAAKNTLFPASTAKLGQSVDSILDSIAPAQPGVNNLAYKTAEDILKTQSQASNDVLNKLYTSAYNSTVPDGALQKLMSDPEAGPIIQAHTQNLLKVDPINNPASVSFAQAYKDNPNSIQVYDMVKRSLDGSINSNVINGQANNVSILSRVKGNLLDTLDAVNPDYATARAIAGDKAQTLDTLEHGIIGKIDNANPEQVQSTVDRIFNIKDPEVFNNVRDLYAQQSPSTWLSMVRQYMENKADSVKSDYSNVNPYTLFKATLGSGQQQQTLLNALDTDGGLVARAKLEAGINLYQELANPGYLSNMSQKIPIIRNFIDSDADKFNNQFINFVTSPGSSRGFAQTLLNKNLTEAQKADAVIGQIMASKTSNLRSSIAAASGAIPSKLAAPILDNQQSQQ